MNQISPLLDRLVSIDSVNPDLVPGARGEADIAAFVASWLEERGLEVHVEDSGKPGRPNVVALARGTGGGAVLMLNAHMDTVGAAGMQSPFTAEIRGGRLYGRGAMDTKAALAAFMCATADAARAELPGDVILTAVVDEEFASAGTEAIARTWRADGAIVGEPTGNRVVIAHKGFAWFEIETRGVAAHGSLPDRGVDAIAKMGKVLSAIEDVACRLRSGPAHPMLGTGSIHASLIRGGQELSSYPATCRLALERRTLPGENTDVIQGELQAILDALGREDRDFSASLRMTFSREPLEAPRDSRIAAVLARQVEAATGKPAVFSGMSGWLDSALLARAGIPTVVLGPDGDGLHGEVEWVDLESVRRCRQIIAGTIREFCR